MINDIPRLDVSLHPIMILGIIIVIASLIAIKFDLKNIIVILLLIIFITILLYFLGLVDLGFSIYAFLLLPFLIIFVCKNNSNEIEDNG